MATDVRMPKTVKTNIEITLKSFVRYVSCVYGATIEASISKRVICIYMHITLHRLWKVSFDQNISHLMNGKIVVVFVRFCASPASGTHLHK